MNYPMYGIQLESFGWMGLRHGHHHERDLTALSSLEQELLAMCFNPETVRKAKAAGVDADKARGWIARGATPSDTVQSLLKQAGVFKTATA